MIPEDAYLLLAEAAADGAEFLDGLTAAKPPAERWYWIVDPDRLNMRRTMSFNGGSCGCVLSQFDPTGYFVLDAFGLSEDEPLRLAFDLWVPSFKAELYAGLRSHAGCKRSSCTHERRLTEGWKALTDLWLEHIYDRRTAGLRSAA